MLVQTQSDFEREVHFALQVQAVSWREWSILETLVKEEAVRLVVPFSFFVLYSRNLPEKSSVYGMGKATCIFSSLSMVSSEYSIRDSVG